MFDPTHHLWSDLADSDFVSRVRADVCEHVAPLADEIDRLDIYPIQSIKALARKGYTALTIAKEYGGGGLGYRHCLALFEEVSYFSAAVGISLITIFQAHTILHAFAPPSLQGRVLPKFAAGLITSYALTEANHGSDIRTLDTQAVLRDDRWILNGRKSFITSGSAAEAYIVLAQSPAGVSTFYIERATPGVSCVTGPNAATFGLRNGPHVDLILENVEIPTDQLIGVEGKGVSQAVTTLDFSRTLAAGISLGIARAAFDRALHFASNRVAFGKAVAEFQGIQWYFAEMLCDIDAARLLTYDAARALDERLEIARRSSEAKLMASRVAMEVASRAVQICGAHGVMESAPFGRYLRDAKAYEIAGGSSEILKNTIARHLQKLFPPTGRR